MLRRSLSLVRMMGEVWKVHVELEAVKRDMVALVDEQYVYLSAPLR
jgi:hypothetical protein